MSPFTRLEAGPKHACRKKQRHLALHGSAFSQWEKYVKEKTKTLSVMCCFTLLDTKPCVKNETKILD